MAKLLNQLPQMTAAEALTARMTALTQNGEAKLLNCDDIISQGMHIDLDNSSMYVFPMCRILQGTHMDYAYSKFVMQRSNGLVRNAVLEVSMIQQYNTENFFVDFTRWGAPIQAKFAKFLYGGQQYAGLIFPNTGASHNNTRIIASVGNMRPFAAVLVTNYGAVTNAEVYNSLDYNGFDVIEHKLTAEAFNNLA